MPRGGWKHNPKPASGIPAKGEGWGGPAKGASTSRIKPGDPDGIQALSRDASVADRREARIAALKAKLEDLAFNAQREETQLSAAVALLNREEGMPVARQITADATVEQVLRIEIVDEQRSDPATDSEAGTSAARLQH